MTLSTTIQKIAHLLLEKKEYLLTVESITGGLIAKTLTDFAGSSRWFEGGFITYSENAKHKMVSVPRALLLKHGAVSKPIVIAMAQGAQKKSGSSWIIAVTGIAGPDGGCAKTPVGSVWIAILGPQKIQTKLFHFSGNRNQIRQKTLKTALEMLLDQMEIQKSE